MMSTVKSFRAYIGVTHEKLVLWLLQANQLKFASGESSDPTSTLPTHQARTESISTSFSTLINLAPMNANLESTWK